MELYISLVQKETKTEANAEQTGLNVTKCAQNHMH